MIVLQHANLYDPQEKGIVDILICNAKIAAIEKTLDLTLPNVEIIDLEGATVIPGLIDQHVHITGGGGENGFSSRVVELQLSQCLQAGVTTVVGLLGTDSRTRSIANLVAKTKGLNEEGITAFCLTGGYEYPSKTLTGSVGDDITFINEVLGVKIAISDHRCSHISKHDLTALASEARIAGLLSRKPGVVHLHIGSAGGGIGVLFDIVRDSNIPITQLRPTHLNNFIDDAPRFIELGGYVDCTSGRSPQRAAQQIVELSRISDARRITLSSDANGSLPVWNEAREIVGLTAAEMGTLFETIHLLVTEHGVPLEQAIAFSTENVAKSLGLYPHKGALKVGSDADLVVLDDGLSIRSLYGKGKAMIRNGEILVKGTFE